MYQIIRQCNLLCLISSSVVSSFFFPSFHKRVYFWGAFSDQLEGRCTDFKAQRGRVTVILGYMNKMWLDLTDWRARGQWQDGWNQTAYYLDVCCVKEKILNFSSLNLKECVWVFRSCKKLYYNLYTYCVVPLYMIQNYNIIACSLCTYFKLKTKNMQY